MALDFSTAYRNMRMMGCSFNDMFEGGEIVIYSGSVPSLADTKPGTRLATITLASGTRTPETYATGIINLTAGAAGSVDTITIDGYEIMGASVAYDTSRTVTAAAVATQINKYAAAPFKVWASSSGENITIYACPGYGTGLNTLTIAHTETTLTVTINGASSATMGGAGATAGVASVNGLTWDEVSAGVISKTGVWSGVCDVAGTASYWRLVGGSNATDEDSGGTTDSAPFQFPRIQGTCGLAGADMNMDSLTFTAGNTYTIDTFQITEPSEE